MIAAAAALAGCTASAPPPSPASSAPTVDRDPFPSSYRPPAARPVALVGATVLTATGEEIANGTLLMEGGKIAAVGAALPVPPGYRTIDRSEERRVGKECVSTCRSRWWPVH